MDTDELVEGQSYDVTTSDGTVYEDALLLEKFSNGSVAISVGIAVVFLAEHELAGAELVAA